MNKTKAVKEHLENKGHISSMEAFRLYNATRLSAIIFNLRKSGMDIKNNWKESIDMNGDKSTYVDYTFEQMVKDNENHIPFI